jgi:hypothetical protein
MRSDPQLVCTSIRQACFVITQGLFFLIKKEQNFSSKKGQKI